METAPTQLHPEGEQAPVPCRQPLQALRRDEGFNRFLAAVLPPLPVRRSLLEGRGFVMGCLLSDLAALAVAVGIALAAQWRDETLPMGPWALLALPPLSIVLLYMRGQYRQELRPVLLKDLGTVGSAVSIASMALIAVALSIGDSDHAGILVVLAWGLGIALGGCPVARGTS